ncbi:MAG: DMT family transporter [Candidatus Berkiella sp.]
MKNTTSEFQGSVYAILSGVLYGLVGYFGITLMQDFSIANTQFWRFLISALFIIIFFAKQCLQSKDSLSAMLKTFCFGGLFYALAACIYYVSSEYIGTGPSMVIFFTYPAIVMLLNSILYKQHVPKIYYAAILLVAFGMTQLIDLKECQFDLLGIGLAVLSSFAYACYVIVSKKIEISPVMSTVSLSLGGAFACLCYSLWDHSFIIPTTGTQWVLIFSFAIFTTAIPILLFLESLKKISSEKASILSVTEPLFVVIFGILLLEEAVDIAKVIGIVAILAGALMTLSNKNKLNSSF